MIIRDLFTNEDVYDWSDVCEHEKVPHCYYALHRRSIPRRWLSTKSA